jgi:hypothetical protein
MVDLITPVGLQKTFEPFATFSPRLTYSLELTVKAVFILFGLPFPKLECCIADLLGSSAVIRFTPRRPILRP